MQQEEEVVTLPGIRERMALFKKAGKKIIEEISVNKQQEQRRVGKLDPKKADVKSFTSTNLSPNNRKPKFHVQSSLSDLQLDDMEISASDLAEASRMVSSSKGKYNKGNYGGSVSSLLSLSSASPSATASSPFGKARGGARPRFGRTYSFDGHEPTQKPQSVKDRDEANAKESINAILKKEMSDEKVATSFPSIRVRYLTAMGTLRPDYYDSSESIRNLRDAAAVRKRLAEKRKIEAERKRRYDKLKSAWEDYEEVAQDKPTELTAEDAEIERDLDEIEADIAQEWQEFTEDVIRVAEEQAEADADAAAERSDDDEDNPNNKSVEDSDVENWRQEAKRLKADAAARRKRREAHARHRQARILKAKNDHDGARAIQAQAEVNMREARTLRDEARKEVVTIDVDALETVDLEEEGLLEASTLSFTDVSNPDDDEAIDAAVDQEINEAVAAHVNDGGGDEKKEDRPSDPSDNQETEDSDDDDDDDDAKATKSKRRSSNRGLRPGMTRGHSFDNDDEEPKEQDDGASGQPKPQKRNSGVNRGTRPGVMRGGSFGDDDDDDDELRVKYATSKGNAGGDSSDNDSEGKDSQKKKPKRKSKSKKDNGSDEEPEEEYSSGEVSAEESSDDDQKTKKKSPKSKKPLANDTVKASKSTIRMQRRASLASTTSCSSDEDDAAIKPVRRQSRRASLSGSLQAISVGDEEPVQGKKKSLKTFKDTAAENEDQSLTKKKASKEFVAFDTYPQKNLDGSDWINPFKAWTNKPKKTKMEGARISVKAPEKTDNWRKTRHNFIMDNAPFYWHKVSGSFQVMVKVTGDLGGMYDKAGLMIRVDAENWIMTGMEFYNNQMNHSTCVTHDYTDWSLSPLPASVAKDGAWFCLKRIGNSYEAFYSLDGNKWIQTRQGLFNDATSVQVGIFCACPMGESYKVSFDMYRCKNLIE